VLGSEQELRLEGARRGGLRGEREGNGKRKWHSDTRRGHRIVLLLQLLIILPFSSPTTSCLQMAPHSLTPVCDGRFWWRFSAARFGDPAYRPWSDQARRRRGPSSITRAACRKVMCAAGQSSTPHGRLAEQPDSPRRQRCARCNASMRKVKRVRSLVISVLSVPILPRLPLHMTVGPSPSICSLNRMPG